MSRFSARHVLVPGRRHAPGRGGGLIRRHAEAQHAVDSLSDEGFPVQCASPLSVPTCGRWNESPGAWFPGARRGRRRRVGPVDRPVLRRHDVPGRLQAVGGVSMVTAVLPGRGVGDRVPGGLLRSPAVGATSPRSARSWPRATRSSPRTGPPRRRWPRRRPRQPLAGRRRGPPRAPRRPGPGAAAAPLPSVAPDELPPARRRARARGRRPSTTPGGSEGSGGSESPREGVLRSPRAPKSDDDGRGGAETAPGSAGRSTPACKAPGSRETAPETARHEHPRRPVQRLPHAGGRREHLRARGPARLRRRRGHGVVGAGDPGLPAPVGAGGALRAAGPGRARPHAAAHRGLRPRPWDRSTAPSELASPWGRPTSSLHPPFFWQTRYARGFVAGVALRETTTGMHLCVENMFTYALRRPATPAELQATPRPGTRWARATTRSPDISHAATSGSDALAMARAGADLRHLH